MPQIPIHPLPRLRSIGTLSVALGLAVSLLAAIAAMAEPSRDIAGASAGEESIASVAVLVPDDRLDRRIVALELAGTTWTRSVERLDAALFAVADNERRLAGARERSAQLATEATLLDETLRAVVAEAAGLSERLVEVEAVLRERALDRYVHFGDRTLVGLGDPAEATDEARSVALVDRVDEVQFSTRTDLLARQAATTTEARALEARAVELAAERRSTEAVVTAAAGAVERLAAEVEAATDAVRRARWTAVIPGIDLSVVALDAYLNAEELLATASPACGIDWWMIAGVARIESRHGRFGGRTLRADGRVDRPIIGIALDGGPGVRAMVDTDDGVYDGDDVWDRAVGPLQFIPETWLRRGRDGSGDGWADPQNIYDAAYSAGRYLCALGGDLGTQSALRTAYFGYNNSSQYVEDVLGHALGYAEFPLPVVELVENPDGPGD